MEYVQLGEVATLQAGIGFPLNLQGRKNGLFPFAKVGDISRCGRTGNSVLATADHFVDQADIDTLRAKPVPVGSVLFAKIGEAIRQNHRVVAGCRMLIDNNAMAAIPGERIDGRFLYHFLKTVDFYCLAPATTVPALRKSDLERLPTPLPPLPEQIRIAAILDQADALRVKRREVLAQLDNLTQAIFIDMFGDPVTNPKGWTVKPLSTYILNVTNGMTRRRSEADQGTDIVLRLRDIRSGWIDFSDVNRITTEPSEAKRFKASTGDLLFIRVNGNPDYVGRCAVFEGHSESIYFNDHIMRVKVDPEGIDSTFLAFLLNGYQGKNEIAKHRKTSAGQHTINQDGLGKIQAPVPPIALQVEFVRRLKAISTQKAVFHESLKELDNLFASLQHSAFRGEL